MKSIIVVGSLNMDLVVRTSRHPQLGETILGGVFQTFPGGKGANQAVAAARVGANVKMIGRVGRDAFGEALLATVAADGVDTAAIAVDETAATGVALITVSEDGQNTIVVASGANAQVTPQDILRNEAVFEGAGILVVQLEVPLLAVEQAVRLAKKHAVRVILNPAPAQPLPDGLLALVDDLVPNQTELALLSGNPGSQDAAVATLQKQFPGRLVLTQGSDGVLVVEGNSQRHFPAFRVQPVDTVAAGDAFIGAYAVALNEGKTLEDAVRWGCAAGAIAVTRPGAQPSLPTRAELTAFLAEPHV